MEYPESLYSVKFKLYSQSNAMPFPSLNRVKSYLITNFLLNNLFFC